MGKTDIATKKYLENNGRFADVVNFSIFDGEEVIEAEQLEEQDPSELSVIPVWGEGWESRQKYRDVLKRAVVRRSGSSVIAIIGIENQAEVHYAMPVRNLLYDAINYSNQLEEIARENRGKKGLERAEFLAGFKKTDKLIPVITIVVYFGGKAWDGARRLHEILDFKDERLKSAVPDYRINLVDPAEIQDFSKFKSSIRLLFQAIKASASMHQLQRLLEQHYDDYESFDRETGELIQELTHIPVNIDEKGAHMCTAMKEIREYERNEGIKEGRKAERANTAREKARADAAKARADAAEALVAELKAQIAAMK